MAKRFIIKIFIQIGYGRERKDYILIEIVDLIY